MVSMANTWWLLAFLRSASTHPIFLVNLDLCQFFSFFVTLSILHIKKSEIPLWNVVSKGFIASAYTTSSNTLWPPNWKKIPSFGLEIVSVLHTELEYPKYYWKLSSHQWLHFILLCWWALNNLWGRYDTKHENFIICDCALCNVIVLICSKCFVLEIAN